jgi:hypothetical protein
MNQHKEIVQPEQVEIIQSEVGYTRYAGAVGLKQIWKQLKMPHLLKQAGIHYGQGEDKAADYLYALTVGPLLEAHSVRGVAQRFGAEPSWQAQECDQLLAQQVEYAGDQRTLCRFVNSQRHEWLRLHQAKVKQLQKRAETRMAADGVIVIDDMPIVKAFARKMDYLSTIYDSNHKRYERGFLLVHLYYHHATKLSYSLSASLWRKSSLSGETRAKPRNAMRRAQAGEELSKLDIALNILESLAPLMADKPTVVFDSWYLARWFVAALTKLGFTWISQASRQRKFEVAAGYLDVKQLIAHYRRYLTPVPGLGKEVRAYALPAVMRPDEYTRQAQAVQLVLVEGFFRQDKAGTIRLLVTNQRTLSLRTLLMRFGVRAQIEQVHRTGKQFEGWGDFHSRSWPSLQAHCASALLRALLVSLLGRSQELLHSLSVEQLIYLVIRAVSWLRSSTKRNHFSLMMPRGQPALAAALV